MTGVRLHGPVLIGPVCAGKSTVAPIVASLLGKPAVDIDDLAAYYLDEIGRGFEAMTRIGDAEGFMAAYLWWEPGLVHVVERTIEDHPGSVLAMGAGHTHFLTPGLFTRVERLLTEWFPVLLLPSPDLNKSVEILRGRSIDERDTDWKHGEVDFIERWVKDPENHQIAQLTVFTAGQTPNETAAQIADAFRARSY